MSNSKHTTLFCGIIAALTLALTPRQFAAQLRVHESVIKQMHGATDISAGASTGYIDQIPGW